MRNVPPEIMTMTPRPDCAGAGLPCVNVLYVRMIRDYPQLTRIRIVADRLERKPGRAPQAFGALFLGLRIVPATGSCFGHDLIQARGPSHRWRWLLGVGRP